MHLQKYFLYGIGILVGLFLLLGICFCFWDFWRSERNRGIERDCHHCHHGHGHVHENPAPPQPPMNPYPPPWWMIWPPYFGRKGGSSIFNLVPRQSSRERTRRWAERHSREDLDKSTELSTVTHSSPPSSGLRRSYLSQFKFEER